jgi:DNA-binding MarR family transcriptional regulator
MINWQTWYLKKALAGGFHDQRTDDDPGGSAANALAKVVIRKRLDDTPHVLMFNEVMQKYVDDEDDIRDEDDDNKLLGKLNQFAVAMTIADPSKSEEQHLYSLLHSAHGRKLAEHLNNLTKKEQPMDIAKVIAITEDALMAQARVHKRADETEAKGFARFYENNIEFRKQWAELTNAKHLLATKSFPNMMGTTPVSTEVTNVNDPIEALAQLNKLVDEQRARAPTLTVAQLFERVMVDPANKELVARTYTAAHRSSTSGSELQR